MPFDKTKELNDAIKDGLEILGHDAYQLCPNCILPSFARSNCVNSPSNSGYLVGNGQIEHFVRWNSSGG